MRGAPDAGHGAVVWGLCTVAGPVWDEERLLAVDPNWMGEIRSWDRFGRVS
jgi:hypothetical protein